jgi:hypothetical protein
MMIFIMATLLVEQNRAVAQIDMNPGDHFSRRCVLERPGEPIVSIIRLARYAVAFQI